MESEGSLPHSHMPATCPYPAYIYIHTHTHTHTHTCYFFVTRQHLLGLRLSRFHDHTQAHHTRNETSGRVIGPSQRPLPDNTQHSQ